MTSICSEIASVTMQILFIHQNLPAQFKHLIAHYARAPEVEVFGLGEAACVKSNFSRAIDGFRLFAYSFSEEANPATYHALRQTGAALRRGFAVAKALQGLRERGIRPDVIYGHPGWGEMLYVRDIFPDARIVNFCEFYFNRQGQDFGFDPEFGEVDPNGWHIRTENMTHVVSLLAADRGISPTEWQRSRYPIELREKIDVVHDGADTHVIHPDPNAKVILRGRRLTLTSHDEVITFVNRNLEPYRGFHVFMRALPEILRKRPQAHVVIVGGDEVSYGRALKGTTWRERLLAEVGKELDAARVHFVGRVKYRDYLRVLQVSTAHVYLTYPFVLSWSMLEAMAVGCVVVGSRTSPVEEVIRDGENGRLVDFFDREELVDAVVDVCAQRERLCPMRAAARATVVQRYDLRAVCLPRLAEVLGSVYPQ
jgi:glycosyltransferase involved in cell wall biosynthesis